MVRARTPIANKQETIKEILRVTTVDGNRLGELFAAGDTMTDQDHAEAARICKRYAENNRRLWDLGLIGADPLADLFAQRKK